jgi:hypothetical protein
MWEEIIKVITVVILPSALKFFLGPIFGYYAKIHIVTLLIGTAAGMMTSVIAFTFFGDWLRSRLNNKFSSTKKKKFTSGNRRIVTVWKKFGLAGVAALTPVLFTPIPGTIIAVSFGAPKYKIMLYMLISAVVWSFIINGLLYYYGPGILPDFMK